MDLRLDAPTLADVQQVREWRNLPSVRPTLRTPFLLTEAQQEAWYRDVVCDRRSPHRYYAVRDDGGDWPLVAFGALENISWENGHGEIGLIVDPDRQGQGIGRAAVALLLTEAFDRMRLISCWGECYATGHQEFWRKVCADHGGSWVTWPRRKWWDGQLWDADLFTIPRPA
jgi:RimJ/RimL family protein N-acetyltransferase